MLWPEMDAAFVMSDGGAPLAAARRTGSHHRGRLNPLDIVAPWSRPASQPELARPALGRFLLADLRGRSNAALTVLNARVDGRDFTLGPRPTIADISTCGYLFWPEEIGVSWSDHPQIGAWLERIKDLPGWVYPYALMPGHPLPQRD